MKNVSRYIQNWVQKGLISEEQAQKIADFELKKQPSHFISWGFLIIGFMVLSLGLISTIAANWHDISDGVKLTIDFLALGLTAYALLRTQEANKTMLFEGLIVFFILLVLASLGLLAQIYQLSGAWYNTLFYWSLITFPIALFSERGFTHFLWTFIFATVTCIKLAFYGVDIGIYTENEALFALVAFAPLASAMIACSLYYLKWDNRFANAFRFFVILSGLFAVIIADFTINGPDNNLRFTTLVPSLLLSLLLIVYLAVVPQLTRGQKILIKLIVLMYFAMFLAAIFAENHSILGAAFSILIYSLSAIYFATACQRGLFNLLTFLVGVRFIFIYINQLYSLATTGVGLILAGVLIILMVYLWQKYKNRLLTWAEELKQ